MKRLFITLICCGLFYTAFSQSKIDSVQVKTDSVKSKRRTFKLIIGGDAKTQIGYDTVKPKVGKISSPLKFGITFSRIDFGFSRLIDNGSFTLSPKNQFLDYRGGKTSYFGFDLVQLRYRFSFNFKVYLAGGFDWTMIRLRQDITIQEKAPVLTYTTDNVNYSKNRFSASYLRIPLAFDFTSKTNKRGKRFDVAFGPEVGFLLDGKVKQISDEMGKKKFYDNYHFSQFKYGAYLRAGYEGKGLFCRYYANNIFENSPAQNGLKSMDFGLTFGF